MRRCNDQKSHVRISHYSTTRKVISYSTLTLNVNEHVYQKSKPNWIWNSNLSGQLSGNVQLVKHRKINAFICFIFNGFYYAGQLHNVDSFPARNSQLKLHRTEVGNSNFDWSFAQLISLRIRLSVKCDRVVEVRRRYGSCGRRASR